ncbi:type II toxin-antitoxin system HicA family toxin [Salinarchaeum chitinilyticum]
MANVLIDNGFVPADRTGSHLKLRWESPHSDEVRIVTVPMKSKDKISRGTFESIAEQSGAKDFRAWCAWIDEQR